MSDLTKRLRKLSRAEHDDLTVAGEAADEIERLTGEVEKYKSLAQQINTDWIPANKKLTDRIKELESTLSEYANKANKDFNAGMETAAIRCAQLADTTRCGKGPHCLCGDAITLKIIDEFELEG